MKTVLIIDGKESTKVAMRKIQESTFCALRHPKKQHLYEIIKNREDVSNHRLMTAKTLSKHIQKHLKSE